MYRQEWLDSSVRALIITATLYSHSSDAWVWLEILIENSVTGQLRPYAILVRTFAPDMTISKYTAVLVSFIVRLLLMCYFLFYYFRTAWTDEENLAGPERRDLKKFFRAAVLQVGFFYDVFLVLLLSVTLVLYLQLNSDEAEILEQNVFKDFHDSAVLYRTIYILNNSSFFLILLKTLHTFKFHRRVYLLLLSIGLALKDLVKYTVVLLPIFLGLCFLALAIWGPYYTRYRSFSHVLLNNLFFSIGVGTTSTLIRLNQLWTVLFYIVYLFFVVFFVISAFIGIFMDAYRQVRMLEGYQDDIGVNYPKYFRGIIPKSLRTSLRNWWRKRKSAKKYRKAQLSKNYSPSEVVD